MFTDTQYRKSGNVQEFPVRELSAILQKSESEILDYYHEWRNSRKQNRLDFDQSFIAGLVGQSKTTVSNFINRRFQNISAPKQELLRQVIESLGYKPSQSAQLIRAKEKRVVGIVANITQTPSKQYISRVLEGIKLQASKYRYSILLYDVTQSEQSDFIREMSFWGLVDGLIIIGSMLGPKDYHDLTRRGLPVSLVNPWSEVPEEFVHWGAVVGSIKADLIGLQDLFACYRSKVQAPVLLTISVDKYKQRQKKIDLYQKYYNGDILFLDSYSVESVEKVMHQIDLARYDAFFCLADLVAIYIWRCLEKRGQKALVTGYDNTDLARIFGIPTVDHDIFQQGVEAFTRLFLAFSYQKINDGFLACEFRKLKSHFVKAS